MSQGPLCPNMTKKVQKEVSQMANRNLSHVILLGGLSVNLNHLKSAFVEELLFPSKSNFQITIMYQLKHDALDFIQNNILRGGSRGYIIFEKIQGGVNLTNLKTFDTFVFHNYQK